jgi:hypothetical protein
VPNITKHATVCVVCAFGCGGWLLGGAHNDERVFDFVYHRVVFAVAMELY